tara:strand:+ start:42 stop:410 length:369 start_codon:yes stop_codon:yes gene_type:complete
MEKLTHVYDERTVDLKLSAAGASTVQKDMQLPDGAVIGMALVWRGTKPTESVKLRVLDAGSEIIRGKNYQFYEKTAAGKYTDSLYPATFQCNRTITVELYSTAALAADFSVEVMFLIYKSLE